MPPTPRARLALVLLASSAAAGCTHAHRVEPRLAPEQVAPLAPPVARKALVLLASSAFLAAAGCTHAHRVEPRLAPEQVAPLAPPVARKALLVLTPSFTDFVASNTVEDPHLTIRSGYRVGPAASRLLESWVARSFATVEVRRLSEVDALRTLVAGDAAGGAEVVLVPRFEFRGEPYERGGRLGRQRFVARLRVDARSTSTGAVRSWLLEGRSEGRRQGRNASGLALERAVDAFRDSLAASRGAL